MTPTAQLASFIGRYDPAIAKEARAALATLRKRLPGAVELVYDNYNALVIAFGASERMQDIVCSLALYPRWLTLFFMHGARLRDPRRRLAGSGSKIRQVRLEAGAATLDEPAVRDLFDAALEVAPAPIDRRQRRRLVIKAVVAKQRPRRPE
jgi:hypothetical protein